MRRTLLALTLLALIAPTGLYADELSCNRDKMLEQLDTFSDTVAINDTPEQNLLLFKLDQDLIADKDVIGLEIFLGSKLLHQERILPVTDAYPKVAAKDSKGHNGNGAVVELLAIYPRERARLVKLAAAHHGVTAVIRLNGDEITRLPFADLVASSAALAEAEQLPVTIRTEVPGIQRINAGPKALTKVDPACEDMCWDEFDMCIEGRCEYNPCDYCYTVFEDCMERNCGQCQPETTTSTSVSVVSLTPTGTFYCVDNYFGAPWNPLTWHEVIQIKWKQTVTTTTLHEDCSETVSTQVSYFYTYCFTNTMSACPVRNLIIYPEEVC